MANKKISTLDDIELVGGTSTAGIVGADVIPVTDVSDTTGSAQGTTKKVTVSDLMAQAPVQTSDVPTVNSGTAANLPSSPATGDVYLETDTGKLRWWDGSYWNTFNYDVQYDPNYAANQLGYSGGLFTSTNYSITTQPKMHFDAAILDGSDQANNPSAGSAVGTWGDRSGQAVNYDATQATGSAQPTFNVSGNDKYVTFDGGDVLNLANNNDRATGNEFTLVTVAQAASSGANHYMMPNVDNTYGSVQLGYYSSLGKFMVRATQLGTSAQDYYSILNLLVVTRDSSNLVTIYRDGGSSLFSVTKSSVFNINSLGRSGGTYTTGDFYEVLMFNSLLSNSDLNTINSYLSNKYSGLPTLTTWT